MSLYEKIFDSSIKAKATRLAFGEKLKELGSKNEQIVVLEGDLSKSTRTDLFAAECPDRFFNMGIAEANMIGVAAGFARAGKVPFAASFGCFLTGRFDQIRMSVSFTGAAVNLIGSHAGVGIGEDGHSQMALEDVTLMRSLPNVRVFQPSHERETHSFMEWTVKDPNPSYMRVTRQGLPQVKDTGATFKEGHWEFLHESKEENVPCIVATGGVLEPSVKAADELIASGAYPDVSIVNASWLNPVSKENIDRILALKPSFVVSVEDHYKMGGLGGILAEMLSERPSSPALKRIGVTEFGQSGSPSDNYENYGFTGPGIAKQITGA
ncbi:transketolase family protein [bacterium]|nr:transketolase family protein [bacterium]